MAEKRQKSDAGEYQRGRDEALDAVLAILHSQRDHNAIRRAVERLRHAAIADA